MGRGLGLAALAEAVDVEDRTRPVELGLVIPQAAVTHFVECTDFLKELAIDDPVYDKLEIRTRDDICAALSDRMRSAPELPTLRAPPSRQVALWVIDLGRCP